MLGGSRLSGSSRFLSNTISSPICTRCIIQLGRTGVRHIASSRGGLTTLKTPQSRSLQRSYFAPNKVRDHLGNNVYGPLWASFFTDHSLRELPSSSISDIGQTRITKTVVTNEDQPVITRARQRKRQKEEDSSERSMPLDASSQLSAISQTQPPSSIRRIFTSCLALSKPRLSFLMVLATAASYTLYPTPSLLLSVSDSTSSPSLSALTLLYLTVGTSLCCASANSLNMLLEPQHDAKMSRTRNRPLVRGLISKRVAILFAAVTASLGVTGLYFGVNPTTAFLGGLNIVLYAGVYTPLKRISVVNTWVGAIVGGIPPLMGWAAAAGQSAVGAGDWQELLLGRQNMGGWLLAALLFAWQFPHFNALSWMIREEYKNAGYRMLCWANPKMNGRVALRYAILMFPICFGLSYVGVTDRVFVVTSSFINAWVLREAYKFWRLEGHKGSARSLFWAGVWQLPIVMALAMFHKNGFWEGIWKRITGEGEEGDDDLWIEDEIETKQSV
jgi:heme o synthase